jgi:hypothetical protein
MPITIDGSNGISDVRSTTDGSAATPAIRGTDANTGIFFPAADTIAFSEGGVESMRITSAGDVGIGTASPARKLHVKSTDGVQAIFETTGASAGFQAFTNAGSFTVGAMDYTSSAMIFYTGNGAAGAAERMRIDSSGRVCIGVNSAAYSTACAMNVNVDTVSASGGAWVSKAASTSTAFHMNFQNGNGGVGGISTNASSTQYVTSSDYRLKNSITPMTGALAKVAQLKPVTYKWKVDGSDGQGFIAHELQEVIAGCVTGEKDAVETYTDEDGNEQTIPKYQGIDTSFLVATLTAAIQELKATVDAQAVRIAALEGAAE